MKTKTKNYAKRLTVLVAAMAIFTSCTKDGDWDDSVTLYGFDVEIQSDTKEKPLTQVASISFVIKPKYDFDKVPMEVSCATSDGVLKLNGYIDVRNGSKYSIEETEGMFTYVPESAGTHKLTLVFENSKGAKVEKEIVFEYAVSEFTVVQVSADPEEIWGAREYAYDLKIVPKNEGQSMTGYQIRFDYYPGLKIRFNDEPVEADGSTYYSISNASYVFTVFLTPSAFGKDGRQSLSYTVKNETTEISGWTIGQNVKKPTINWANAGFDKSDLAKGDYFTLSCDIIQNPETTPVYYKMWLTSESGTSTNNFGVGGDFSDEFIAADIINGKFTKQLRTYDPSTVAGHYTLHLQFRDAYGNETTEAQRGFDVASKITVEGSDKTGAVYVARGSSHKDNMYLSKYHPSFKVTAHEKYKILNVKYEITGSIKKASGWTTFTYTGNTITLNSQSYESELISDEKQILSGAGMNYAASNYAQYFQNVKIKITVSTDAGSPIVVTQNANVLDK
ncbi:MAG: hypothetical protein LBR48_06325 [Dysgonamonadaceae bacterium]|jgi:hypothetical protein|nr:hypothetical protein [Dysgonamonadaceae bacterium]